MSTYADLVDRGNEQESPLIIVEYQGTRATVTLSDPKRLNALSSGMMVQLNDTLASLTRDPSIRCIILTGADPAFSAGGDLSMIAEGSRAMRDPHEQADTTDAWRWIRHQFGHAVRTIVLSDKLFVAAVNGAAAGVGMAFALACDVILASERCTLVPAFGRLGLVPEVGTSWFLTRRLGYQAALALYIRGEHLSADAAHQLGIVQEVHPHDKLLGAAAGWCAEVERMPTHAFAMTKTLLRGSADVSWHQALELEEFAEANCFSTATLSQAADSLRNPASTDRGQT